MKCFSRKYLRGLVFSHYAVLIFATLGWIDLSGEMLGLVFTITVTALIIWTIAFIGTIFTFVLLVITKSMTIIASLVISLVVSGFCEMALSEYVLLAYDIAMFNCGLLQFCAVGFVYSSLALILFADGTKVEDKK
jgi:hypothetical protein